MVASARYRDFRITTVVDETLREGLERCMFPIALDDLFRLVQAQYDAGIRDTIVGAGPGDTALLERICAEQDRDRLVDLRPIFLVLLNCWEATFANLRRLPTAWLERLTIGFGMIEHRAGEQLFERVLDRFAGLGVRTFKSSVLNDFTGGYDDERHYAEIHAQVERGARIGIGAFRINDSVGKLFPEDVAKLCSRLVADFTALTFCLHCHDDRGLALANQLTSLYHGFHAVEGSLCGFGNRSGITALEQIVAACQDKNIRIGEAPLDLDRLCENARLAEEIYLAVPSTYRAVSGRFAAKTHFGVLNIPDFLGAAGPRDYYLSVVNLHRDTIVRALGAHGFPVDDALVDELLVELRGLIEARHAGARDRHHALLAAIDALYCESQLSVSDIVALAQVRRAAERLAG